MTDGKEANPLALVEHEVGQVIEDLDLHSYYQLLEVELGASGAQIASHHQIITGQYGLIAQHPACTPRLRSDLALIRERLDEALQVLGDPRLRADYDRRLELGETRVALRQTPTGTFSLDDFDREMGVTPPPAAGLEALAPGPSAPAPLEVAITTSPREPPPLQAQPGPAPQRAVRYPRPEESFTDEEEPSAERSSAILRRFMQSVELVIEGDDEADPRDDDTQRMVGLPAALARRREGEPS